MEHYILCASIFMCIALHLARQAALVRRDPINLNSICSSVVTRELRALDPQYVLTVFLFAGSDLSGMYYQFIWVLGQSYIPAFLFQLCALHVYNATNYVRFYFPVYQIYFTVSIKSSI